MAHLFSDLKVLDIATFIAAPGATTMLSDFGADVMSLARWSQQGCGPQNPGSRLASTAPGSTARVIGSIPPTR